MGERQLQPHGSLRFEEHRDDGEDIVCLQDGGQCKVLVEFKGNPEQTEVLKGATEAAFQKLDDFFSTGYGASFADLFSGLHVQYGEYAGGGEALQEDNRIVFDTQNMALPVSDAERYLTGIGVLNPGDWTSVFETDEERNVPGSTARYNVVHEIGHFIDVPSSDGSWEGIDTRLSPTRYGASKPNEAFAEAFTHLVYGKPIDPEAEQVIRQRIDEKINQLNKTDQ